MTTVQRRESIESVLRLLWSETPELVKWVPMESFLQAPLQTDARTEQGESILYATLSVSAVIQYRSTTSVGYNAVATVAIAGDVFDDVKNLLEILRQEWDQLNRTDWQRVVREPDSPMQPKITYLVPATEPELDQDDDDLWTGQLEFAVQYTIPFGPSA